MRRGALTAVVVMLAAGGCTGHDGGTSGTVPARNDCSAMRASVRTDATGGYSMTVPEGGPLPADFRPVSILRCDVTTTDIPGDGNWLVLTENRSTGSVNAFIAALRDAYEKPRGTYGVSSACAAIGPQSVVLVDATGKAFLALVPGNGPCGEPDPVAEAAMRVVPMRVVATDRIKRLSTAAQQATSCSTQWKDEAPLFASEPAPETTSPQGTMPGFKGSTKLKVCYYKVDPGSSNLPVGTVLSSTEIQGDPAGVILDGLAASPSAQKGQCTSTGTSFAVLFPEDIQTGGFVEVELDGCKRATPSSGLLRQPPQRVVDALLAAEK